MRRFQTHARPVGAAGLTFAVAATMGLAACPLDNVPPAMKPMIDARMPRAINLADSAAKLCAEYKESGGSPTAASPAVGTSLAEELEVIEILVRCVWDPHDDTPPGEQLRNYRFPPLRKAAPHDHDPAPRMVYDSFVKDGDHDYERVFTPSQFSDSPDSADIIATRPIPGGGTVEVTVSTVKR